MYPEQREQPEQAPSQELHSACLSIKRTALTCVWEHVCCILIYSVHLLAMCPKVLEKPKQLIVGSRNAQKTFNIN